jgi:hypothetical protein
MSALPAWLFDNFLFRPWPGRWLAGSAWHPFCVGLSVALSLVASGLFLLEQRMLRLGCAPPERTRRALALFIAALSFLAYFDFFNPNPRYPDYYHRHELYHYYLGSKYSQELGYKRLYTCTAIAEVELGFGENIKKARLRDLSAHNVLVPIAQTYVFSDPAQCKSHFSEQRWRAFKSDVSWFERVSRGDYWEHMRIDHGYNPPPVWTMTGKLFASLAPAGDHFFKLLAALDVGLQLGALLLIGWAFGWRSMSVAAVFWGCNGPANFFWTGGAFLRQDWYFAFVAALCLARKRQFALSGAALTWSALLRIFPIVAFAGVGLILLFDVIRKRRLCTEYRRFLLGSALAGALLIGASVAVAGVEAYPAFVDHIGSHRTTQLTNNMGLEMLLGQSWDGRMLFTVDERLEDPMQLWKDQHTARLAQLRPLWAAACLGVLAWLAWALQRTRLLWVGMALSVPLLMCLLNLTCYYFAFCVALAVLVRVQPALGPAYLALAGASQILLQRFYWIDDRYVAESCLFLLFGVSCLYALSRPLRLGRLAVWSRAKWRARGP